MSNTFGIVPGLANQAALKTIFPNSNGSVSTWAASTTYTVKGQVNASCEASTHPLIWAKSLAQGQSHESIIMIVWKVSCTKQMPHPPFILKATQVLPGIYLALSGIRASRRFWVGVGVFVKTINYSTHPIIWWIRIQPMAMTRRSVTICNVKCQRWNMAGRTYPMSRFLLQAVLKVTSLLFSKSSPMLTWEGERQANFWAKKGENISVLYTFLEAWSKCHYRNFWPPCSNQISTKFLPEDLERWQ